MSRNNDSLPMLPPWLSESDVTQVGYEAPVENLPQDDLIDEAPKRRRFMGRGGDDGGRKEKRGRRGRNRESEDAHPSTEQAADPHAGRGQQGWTGGTSPDQGHQGSAGQGFPDPNAGQGAYNPQAGQGPQGSGQGPQGFAPDQQGSGHGQQGFGPDQHGAGHGQQGFSPDQHGAGHSQQGFSPDQQGSGHGQQGWGTNPLTPEGQPAQPTYQQPAPEQPNSGLPTAQNPTGQPWPNPAEQAPWNAAPPTAAPVAPPAAEPTPPAQSLPTRTPAPPSNGFTPLGPTAQPQRPDLPPPPPLPDPPRPTEAPPRLTAPEPTRPAQPSADGSAPDGARSDAATRAASTDSPVGTSPESASPHIAAGLDALRASVASASSETPSATEALDDPRHPTTSPDSPSAATPATPAPAEAQAPPRLSEPSVSSESPLTSPATAAAPEAGVTQRVSDPAVAESVLSPETGAAQRVSGPTAAQHSPVAEAAVAPETRTPQRLGTPDTASAPESSAPQRLTDPSVGTESPRTGDAASAVTGGPERAADSPASAGRHSLAEQPAPGFDGFAPPGPETPAPAVPTQSANAFRQSGPTTPDPVTSPADTKLTEVHTLAEQGESTASSNAQRDPRSAAAQEQSMRPATSPDAPQADPRTATGQGAPPVDPHAATHVSTPLANPRLTTGADANPATAVPTTGDHGTGGDPQAAPADLTAVPDAQRPPADVPATTAAGANPVAPADPRLTTAPDAHSVAASADPRHTNTRQFAPSTGPQPANAPSPYSSGGSVPPQRADERSPYASGEAPPAYAATQYNSIPGDPTHDVQASPDAQTQMFRTEDARLQPGPNQAPVGDAQPWQGAVPAQADYRAADYVANQQGQRPDGSGQAGASWGDPRSAHGAGEFATPESTQQQPDSGRHGQAPYPDGGYLPNGPGQPYQRPDTAPAQQPDAQQYQQQPNPQQYQQPGQYQQPAHGQPGWGAPQGPGYQPPSLDNVPVKRAKKAPGSGWRKAVHHVSGGAINPGMSAEELRLQELVARIRQPVRGDYRIAVLSLKGGVGKTTTTTGLGSIFASIRGDRVIAVDANPDFGTLSQRVALQTRSTVRDLLLDPSIERYSDVRRHTSQSSSRLEVLASERDPAASESFNDEEYRAVARILQRFYNIILTDCGTGLMHSAMTGVLDLAHSLVLISSAAIDGARSAAATLDWLSLHGHDHLVRNAVVVINLPREGSPNVGVQQLREYFLSRCRAVHIIPFDEHLSEGAEIDLHRLHKTTKRAYVELAATVADEFGAGHPRFG
ncbi:AAA family ATPase [Nocardia sp. NPDC059177]|uniref:nucleotide-binding protein n=1 Tax=Nocardia sp. NPDC059177 TaxID=3346759 RepID=UPI0036772B5B